jgi:ketol-acid reductoisomerase
MALLRPHSFGATYPAFMLLSQASTTAHITSVPKHRIFQKRGSTYLQEIHNILRNGPQKKNFLSKQGNGPKGKRAVEQHLTNMGLIKVGKYNKVLTFCATDLRRKL